MFLRSYVCISKNCFHFQFHILCENFSLDGNKKNAKLPVTPAGAGAVHH